MADVAPGHGLVRSRAPDLRPAAVEPLPCDPAPPARDIAGEPRLPLQPVVRALPRERRSDPHRADGPRHHGCGDPLPRRGRREDAGYHRRRAGTASGFPLARRARAGARRGRHGPLEPDHPGRAGQRGPARVSRRQPGGGGGLSTLLHAGARRPPARPRRVRLQHPRAEGPQCPRLRRARERARAQPGVQPARPFTASAAGRARGRLQARPGREPRHPLQRPLHPGQHADRALRLDADIEEAVRAVHGSSAPVLPRRKPGCRDVPQPDLGRMAGLRLRLRLQPDARAAAARRRQAARQAARSHRPRPRRQCHRGARSLLRLHRRPGLELRGRAAALESRAVASVPLASLPSVDRLLRSAAAAPLLSVHGRSAVTLALREVLGELRAAREAGLSETALLERIATRLDQEARPTLRPVFNLTGTVLHTNLGRALLPEAAIEAMVAVARAASNLEYDLADGRRGERDHHAEKLLCALTGAEAAALVDLRRYGLPHEPTPAETLAQGADVVTFSGDKLLGGPQAGIIVGRSELVERMRKNPLKRALRVDKMTLAALAALLRIYTDPDRVAERIPTLRLLARPLAAIRTQAARVQPLLQAALKQTVEVIDCQSQVGSGAAPTQRIASAGLAIRPGSDRLAAAFRALPIPVIGRVQDGAFILDLRCLEDEAAFVAQLGTL